jgi:hypothetical protein
MRRRVVAKEPAKARARLNLAPRLRTDETLSSWLERFAAAYGLTQGEFMRWLGYPNSFSYGRSLIDLDASPPADFCGIMEQHAGTPAHSLEKHRLTDRAVLSMRLRRTFCARCWQEHGPYRHREWASGWALICIRHQNLLSEKPPLPLPVARNAEDSWVAFYESPELWRSSTASWESELWLALCNALGVNPRTEFVRTVFWLRDLQRLAQRDMRGVVNAERDHLESAGEPSLGRPSLTREAISHRLVMHEEWRVKRDLVIYGLLKFHRPSLLQVLDPTISASRLIQSGYESQICGTGSPEAEYHIRLFAALVAQHLWEKLTQGSWRCHHYEKLEVALGSRERWNDEDWWLERRLHHWPSALRMAGRKLFHKEDRWTQLPPWMHCREYCVRHLTRGESGGLLIRLPADWQCRWTGPGNSQVFIDGLQRQGLKLVSA